MKKQMFKKVLSFMLCIMLIAAMALCLTACNKDKISESGLTVCLEGGEIGKGEKTFTFEVYNQQNQKVVFTIHTDKKTVGDALTEHKLIAGDNDQYGLYVKEVNGTVADYDKTKTYWAFYVDGESSMVGVDSTEVKDGSVYAFKIEK